MTDAGPWWDTARPDEHGNPHYYKTTPLDTLLILEVRIDGEHVTFRDAVATFLWAEQFHDPAKREDFLAYWIKKQVGMIAADPARLMRLREKLLIVEPKDQHDLPRCKWSLESALAMIRCDGGEVRKHPPFWLMPADGALPPEPVRLGACPCRCHDMQRQAHGGLPRMLPPADYFRESMLSEEDALL